LTSAGFSQAELAGRLNGSASFVVKNGIWALPSFEDILKNVGDGILSDWGAAPSRSASFGEMSASFTIADGIATTRDLRISAPDIEVTGSGEIDVLRHAIDLKAEPARADGKPAFPVPLIVQGPWLSPRVFPDMPGILEDPDAAYKALHKLKLAQETKK
jgi:AsmA protein